MANMTLIYGGLISLIESTLPTYTRLADALDVTANDILRINKGYSLAIDGGENTFRQICPDQISVSRTFTVTLTNLYTANETDAVGRATLENALYEDAHALWKAVWPITHLGGVQVSNVHYSSDEGIASLFGENLQAISIVSVITAEYFE